MNMQDRLTEVTKIILEHKLIENKAIITKKDCENKLNKCIKVLNSKYPNFNWKDLIYIKNGKVYITSNNISYSIFEDLSDIITDVFVLNEKNIEDYDDFYVNYNGYMDGAFSIEGLLVVEDKEELEYYNLSNEEDYCYSTKCPMCNKNYVLLGIDDTRIIDYKNRGGLIQKLFPELNPMEREFIKTGYCPECQKKLFKTNYSSDKIRLSVNQ